VRGGKWDTLTHILRLNSPPIEVLEFPWNIIPPEKASSIVTSLACLTTLKHLYLAYNYGIGTAVLFPLLLCHSLEHLDLHDCGIGPESFLASSDLLCQQYPLKHINLDKNKFGDAGAKALARVLVACPLLEELRVRCCGYGHEGASALANALVGKTTLQVLSVSANDIGNVGCKSVVHALSLLPSLQELRLSCMQ